MTFIIALPRELLFNIRLGEVSGKVSFCQATFPASHWEAQSSEVSAGCVALYPRAQNSLTQASPFFLRVLMGQLKCGTVTACLTETLKFSMGCKPSGNAL